VYLPPGQGTGGYVPGSEDTEQFDFTGSEWVCLPADELDGPLRGAMLLCVPDGATYRFAVDDDRGWVIVSQPGDTRRVISAARRLLGRG
jgi:hypothetical protein